jgi:hypothetical protein
MPGEQMKNWHKFPKDLIFFLVLFIGFFWGKKRNRKVRENQVSESLRILTPGSQS